MFRNYNVTDIYWALKKATIILSKIYFEKQGTVNTKLLNYEDIMSLVTSILFIGHQIIMMKRTVLGDR